jgi:cupin fold WbuC family metalloprotein
MAEVKQGCLLDETRAESVEVLYSNVQIPLFGKTEGEALYSRLASTPKGTIRLCTHSTPQDLLHEMFILHSQSTYIPPHKHLNQIESTCILNGAADFVIFNEDGSLRQVIPMGDYNSGRPCYIRLSSSVFHTMIIVSKTILFHEVTTGPFSRDRCVFADFAPGKDADDAAKMTYLDRLRRMVTAI